MKTDNLIFSGILVGAFLVLNVSGALAQKSSDHQMIHNGASKTDKTMHKMDKHGNCTAPKLHADRNGRGNWRLDTCEAGGELTGLD